MKILYHHRIVSKDGQYVHLTELVNALKSNGHIIELVGPDLREEKNNSGNAFIDFLKNILPGQLYEVLELSYSIVAYFRLSKAIKKFKPDIIYERYNLFSPAGIWAKKKYSIPLLLEVNAPLYSERAEFSKIKLKKIAKWSELYAWKNADKVLAVTAVLANLIANDQVASTNIAVIPNAINLHQYGQAKVRLPCDDAISDDTFVLGFVGYFREWHGVERLVDYIAQSSNKNLHLLIVGDGPSKENILELAKLKNITDKITITGIVVRELIPHYIQRFDIAVQPNVVSYASPLKLFEYMAAGCAIVAPDMPNIKEILTDHHNALLFAQASDGSLFDAFDKLYADSNLRDGLGRCAKAAIIEKSLTWEGNAKRVESIANHYLI